VDDGEVIQVYRAVANTYRPREKESQTIDNGCSLSLSNVTSDNTKLQTRTDYLNRIQRRASVNTGINVVFIKWTGIS
jgi:hypothetical protein